MFLYLWYVGQADQAEYIDHNIKILNFFNIDTMVTTTCPVVIDIDKYLPSSIYIKDIKEKGWGLISRVKINKDSIIYCCPISIFPTEIKMISAIGEKNIDRKVHLSKVLYDLDLFSYYDALLNHSNHSNAYHDTDILFYKNLPFVMLIASKDIEPEEEITINYLYLETFIIRSLFFKIFPKSHKKEYPEYLDEIFKMTTYQA